MIACSQLLWSCYNNDNTFNSSFVQIKENIRCCLDNVKWNERHFSAQIHLIKEVKMVHIEVMGINKVMNHLDIAYSSIIVIIRQIPKHMIKLLFIFFFFSSSYSFSVLNHQSNLITKIQFTLCSQYPFYTSYKYKIIMLGRWWQEDKR